MEVTHKYFKIISHFNNNRLKRKVTDAFLIKQELSSLNVQDQSVEQELLHQCILLNIITLTRSWERSVPCGNQSIDLS